MCIRDSCKGVSSATGRQGRDTPLRLRTSRPGPLFRPAPIVARGRSRLATTRANAAIAAPGLPWQCMCGGEGGTSSWPAG
eukprot:1064326-Alexandrium_andersonii.AAC.1